MDWKAEPALESGISAAMFHEWLKQPGVTGESSISCLVFSSRPIYRMQAGTLSVKPAKPNQEAKENYSAHDPEKNKTRMIVKGNILVERKREYILIDLGFLRLIPWNGKPTYMKVPLDFTYYSSCPPEKLKMLR